MSDTELPPTPPASPLTRFAGDFLGVLRFYTRFPAPVFRFESAPHALPDFDRAALAIPLVGVVVGLVGACAGGLAYLAGISTTLAAILSIGAMVAITGAFHEDGLADSCDGLFGGTTQERRIEIMRDSRVGTFGAAGLFLGLLLRIFALAELFRLIGPSALALLVGLGALARPLALLPGLWLPPAAAAGLGKSVPMPGHGRALLAIGLGAAIALGCGWWAEQLPGTGIGLLASLVGVYAVTRLAAARINGYTGDVLGAAEQVSEVVMLISLSAAANWNGPL